MPKTTFALLLSAVIVAAGLSVWLFSMGGSGLMLIALPVLMIAAVALKALGR